MKTQLDINMRKLELVRKLVSGIVALHEEAVEDGWKTGLEIKAHELEVLPDIDFSLIVGDPRARPYLYARPVAVPCESALMQPCTYTNRSIAEAIAFYSKHTKKIEEKMRTAWEKQKQPSKEDRAVLDILEAALTCRSSSPS